MDVLHALLLGLVQGLTEFLPVSSDGHLALAERLLGVRPSLAFNVLLHAGTLGVVLVGFRRELASTTRGLLRLRDRSDPDGRLALHVIAASVPTAAIGLALRHPVEAWTASPRAVAAFLALTAALLLATIRRAGERTLDLPRAFAIGVAQGLAVLPGLSRSGSTIAIALLLGVRRDEAVRFSFAASIPAVAGALALELPEIDWASVGAGAALLGVGAAAASGALALAALLRIVRAGRVWWFAAYLVALAAATWVLSG